MRAKPLRIVQPPSTPDPVEGRAATKLDQVLALLQRPEGATLQQMAQLTEWKVRSVRGFMAGALKRKRGLTITSSKADGVRTYRIGAQP